MRRRRLGRVKKKDRNAKCNEEIKKGKRKGRGVGKGGGGGVAEMQEGEPMQGERERRHKGWGGGVENIPERIQRERER